MGALGGQLPAVGLPRRAARGPGARSGSCRCSPGATSRGCRARAPLVFTLHQVASGPEEDALTYSDYAAYDLGQAVAQLSVQALALGLAVHQFAGFDHERLAEVARVPRHWQVTTGVALGRPLPPEEAGDPLARERDSRPRARRPLAELAYGGVFGEALPLG